MMLRGDFHILRNFLIIENTSVEYEARLVTHFLTFLGVNFHRIVSPGVHQLIMFLGIKLDSLTMYLRYFEKVKPTDRSRNEKVSGLPVVHVKQNQRVTELGVIEGTETGYSPE